MISLTCYVLNMTVVSCLQHEKLLGHIAVTALKAVIPPLYARPDASRSRNGAPISARANLGGAVRGLNVLGLQFDLRNKLCKCHAMK